MRHKIKDFSQFWKLYMEGLKKLRDKTKELEDTTFMYKTEKWAVFMSTNQEPPMCQLANPVTEWG